MGLDVAARRLYLSVYRCRSISNGFVGRHIQNSPSKKQTKKTHKNANKLGRLSNLYKPDKNSVDKAVSPQQGFSSEKYLKVVGLSDVLGCLEAYHTCYWNNFHAGVSILCIGIYTIYRYLYYI